ncbi:hypothetical protein Dimus_011738 [Dionaea muscipula]
MRPPLQFHRPTISPSPTMLQSDGSASNDHDGGPSVTTKPTTTAADNNSNPAAGRRSRGEARRCRSRRWLGRRQIYSYLSSAPSPAFDDVVDHFVWVSMASSGKKMCDNGSVVVGTVVTGHWTTTMTASGGSGPAPVMGCFMR